MLYISSKLPNTIYDDLSRNDKKVVSIIDGLFQKNKIVEKIEIPLTSAVDLEKQSEFCADVKTLIRIQYAVYSISSIVFSREVRKDSENKDYFIYFANLVTTADKELEKLFVEAKKSDKKRESSKKAKERSEAKKASAEAEAKKETEALANQFNKRASMKIVDHLQGKYKMNVDRTSLENEIMAILATIQ